jgi:hypothetical protein
MAESIFTSIAISKTSPLQGHPAPYLEELRFTILEDVKPELHVPSYLEYGFTPAPCLTRLVLGGSRIPPPSSKLLSTITTLSIIESLQRKTWSKIFAGRTTRRDPIDDLVGVHCRKAVPSRSMFARFSSGQNILGTWSVAIRLFDAVQGPTDVTQPRFMK